MQESKTVQQMTEEIVRNFKEYEKQGTNAWTYETAVRDLPYQVGNLSKLVLQKTGDRYNEGLSEDEIKLKISDELADIIADVLFISHELDIDMTQAWHNMLASDQQKISERS